MSCVADGNPSAEVEVQGLVWTELHGIITV